MQSSVTDDASTVAELGLVRTTNQLLSDCVVVLFITITFN